MKNSTLNYSDTIAKINSIQHLIGQDAPKWQSPILEIIPAPTNGTFYEYIQVFEKTGCIVKAKEIIDSTTFDILLIFRTPKLHGDLVYEWYSFFYSN